VLIHCHAILFQVSEFHLLQLHGATRHIVSTKTILELIPRDGVDVCMGIVVHLPPAGCHSIVLVRGKRNFLVIHAVGDHELLLNSLKPIIGFQWVLSLQESGRASSEEFAKPGLRWWWLLLLLSLQIQLLLIECLEHCLHKLVLGSQELLHPWVVVGIVGLSIASLTIVVVVPRVHHLRIFLI
jgi:hypothetical protein